MLLANLEEETRHQVHYICSVHIYIVYIYISTDQPLEGKISVSEDNAHRVQALGQGVNKRLPFPGGIVK